MQIISELSKIIINEAVDQQVIVIKEKDGHRSFPIVIGFFEICAIDRRLKSVVPARPMTHDLMGNIISALGGKIEKIVITDLQGHTYFAEIHIWQSGKIVKIDSRPSDAIALGVALNSEIYVEEQVFEKSKEL